MLISDSDCRILAVNARYPGSVHDSAIFQMSNIRNFLRTEYENGHKSSHLIGDSGYALEPWLFTPFLNYEEGSNEVLFNNMLKSARNVIERTNGVLKGRFRCLSRHRVLNYHPATAAYIIYACCVLHNIAIKARLAWNEEMNDADIDEEGDDNVVPAEQF
ncbi:uncharacterized protein CBL_02948 [Carabus blaptoides fortunei]